MGARAYGECPSMEVSGKFRASPPAGTASLCAAGGAPPLFISADGSAYTLAADLVNAAGTPDFDLTDSAHYTDVQLDKGQWLYFKAVLIVSDARSFIGVGCGRFVGDSVRVEPLNAYPDAYAPEAVYDRLFLPARIRVRLRPNAGIQTVARFGQIQSLGRDVRHRGAVRCRPDELYPFRPHEHFRGQPVRGGRRSRRNGARQPADDIRRCRRPYLPVDFELYGGETPDDMTRIAAVTDAAVTAQT